MKQKKINTSDFNSSFYTNAIEITVIALIILSPIAFYSRCIDVFNPAKELLAEILVLLALMFWGLRMIKSEEIKFTSIPLNLPILSFIAICTLSLVWSNTFFTSLKELPLFLAGPLLYFIIVNNIKDEKQISRLLGAVVLIGTVFGIYGIFQYNGIDFSFWVNNIGRHHVFGLFGNVNYFAEYLIVPLPLTISLFFALRNRTHKILLLVGILTMGSSLFLTFTRGSYLAIGISSIFMFFLFLFFFSKGKSFIKENKKFLMVILIAIITAAFLFIIPTSLNKPGTAISQIKERISIENLTSELLSGRRVAIWKCTWMMIKDHPILGLGIGTYKYNTLRYQAKFFEQGNNRSIYPYGFADKTHNEYLQLWAELGAIGLAIFLWLVIAYFNYGIRYLKREEDEQKQGVMIGLMGAVVAVLVDGIFGFPLHLPATIVLFWLIMGLAVAMGIEKNVESGSVSKSKRSSIYRLKLPLYIVIILLTAFLCITVARSFMARIYWYYGNEEIINQNYDYDEAINIYEKALKWDPYLGNIYYDLGIIFMKRELGNTALINFKKSAKYFDFPYLPQNLAIFYLAKGDLDEAIYEFKRAISYQRNIQTMPPLYVELGNAYLKLERYEPAEAAFNDALKIDSNIVSAHYGLSGVYLRQNRIEEGLIELKKVVELDPKSEEAKYARDAIQKIEQAKLESQPAETN